MMTLYKHDKVRAIPEKNITLWYHNSRAVYTTTQSNLEMLQLCHDDELVSDEAAAMLIGDAKGRSDGMLSVPPSVDGKSNRKCYSG